MKLILVSFLMFQASFVLAVKPNAKGKEIAKKVESANDGYVGEESQMRMILLDSSGSRIERTMEGKTLERPDDGDKSLSEFLTPGDVRGTKMLTWTNKTSDDDQWLYLPSLRRVKRISSRNKSSSYMGSEFTYEDLGGQDPEKFDHQFIKETPKVWVLERKKKAKSAYSKERVYISKEFMNPIKAEYYDRKGELLKIGTFEKFKQYKVGKKNFFRAHRITMKNVQNKKTSIIEFDKRSLGKSFSSRVFRKESLKK